MTDSSSVVKRRRGRPRDTGALYDQVRVRMNCEVRQELKKASDKYNISQADLIREGIRIRLDLLKKEGVELRNREATDAEGGEFY